MNDTTYLASVLDAHRAEDLRREVELLAQHAERGAAPAASGGAVETVHHRSWWPHRSARRTTFVATR